MGTIGAHCSRVATATTPGPPPQPHAWVRLGFEVSRFSHFWVGSLASAEFPRGLEFWGSLAPLLFLHILNPNLYWGGGQICPPSSFFCYSSETVGARLLKLYGFYC